jgi:hypothetical protein
MWEPGPLDSESLKFETVKFGHDFRGTGIKEKQCWRGPTATVNYRRACSSERAPHINNPVTI